MKRIIVSGFLLTLVSVCHPAVITWDGEAGDGRWSNPINWSGNLLPGPSDEIVLDNSIAGASYIVTLPDITVTVSRILISPLAGNEIILLLPVSNTLNADAFVTTGSGYVFTIDAGGIFINNGKVTSGTNLTLSDSIRINNGGRYIHRTRSGHSAWIPRLSRAAGTEKGIFEFDVPVSSFTVSLSGRVYGTLVFTTLTNGAPVTYSGSGAQNATVRGDLQLLGESNFALSFTTGDFIVNGQLIQLPGATFNLQTSSNSNFVKVRGNVLCEGTITKTGSGLPELQLDGAINQQVLINNLAGFVMMNVNNSEGITLSAPLQIPYLLRLTNGKIFNAPGTVLTIADNAVIIGGSDDRFVTGPIRKLGNESFMFPLGKGMRYAPVAISAGADITEEYIAEYHVGNPQWVFGNSYDTPITHMSALEWWGIDRRSGSAPREVTIFVTAYSDATLLADLRVLRYDGSFWKNEGNISYFGLSVGPITSQPISNFNSPGNPTPFSIGSVSAVTNPLDVEMVRFDGTLLTRRSAKLEWEIADYPEDNFVFEVQRDNGNGFVTIGTVSANPTATVYQFIDYTLRPGENFYRIRILALATNTVIGKTIMVYNPAEIFSIRSVVDRASIQLHVELNESQMVNIMIADNYGRMIWQRSELLVKGRNHLVYPMNKLPAGIYNIIIIGRKAGRQHGRVFIE